MWPFKWACQTHTVIAGWQSAFLSSIVIHISESNSLQWDYNSFSAVYKSTLVSVCLWEKQVSHTNNDINAMTSWADLYECDNVEKALAADGGWCHSGAAGVIGWSAWLHNRSSIQIKSKRETWLDLTHYPRTVIKAWGWRDAWTLWQEHHFVDIKHRVSIHFAMDIHIYI